MQVKAGDTYHIGKAKLHVVAVIEDGGEKLCVVKEFVRWRQYWSYSVRFYDNVAEDIEYERKRAASKRKLNKKQPCR